MLLVFMLAGRLFHKVVRSLVHREIYLGSAHLKGQRSEAFGLWLSNLARNASRLLLGQHCAPCFSSARGGCLNHFGLQQTEVKVGAGRPLNPVVVACTSFRVEI